VILAEELLRGAVGDHRPEDGGAPALRWNEVDLDAGTVAVYRAVLAIAEAKTR
jgi:hypothetical protein